MDPVEGIEKPAKPLKPRKKFVGSSAKASSSKTPVRRVANQIPDDILSDPHLAEAIKGEYHHGIHVAQKLKPLMDS